MKEKKEEFSEDVHYDFPMALNPEMYRTHFDWEAEDRQLKEEARKKKAEEKRVKREKVKALFHGKK